MRVQRVREVKDVPPRSHKGCCETIRSGDSLEQTHSTVRRRGEGDTGSQGERGSDGGTWRQAHREYRGRMEESNSREFIELKKKRMDTCIPGCRDTIEARQHR